MDNRSISHTRWKCQYHIVFIPKYRKKVLYGKVREDIREILNTLCKYKNVEIVAGAVCVDHVHLSVAIPPKLSISNFMGYLKGKSTLMLYDRHPELQSKWDKAFWARGYYVETIGNITDEAVQKYIKEQAEEYGHSFERELSYMVVHGFYHLMGYDHIREEDKVIMRPKEEKVLNELGIRREEMNEE